MAAPVVVASDFSPSARVALRQASRIAGERGAPLHAVTVVDSDDIAMLAASVPFTKEQVEAQVSERTRSLLRRELDEAGVKASEVKVVVGRPAARIEEVCEAAGAGLLVIGYHGKTERAGGPGSVASRCVRHAPCDVLLVRRSHPGGFKKVAVGVDFTDSSLAIVSRAAEMTDRDGGRLVLIHAYANPIDSLAYAGYGLDVPLDSFNGLAETLAADLERIASGLRHAVPGGVEAQTLLDPHHGRALSDWSKDNGADLVVVGTRARPGLRYWLLGSTAEYVLRETPAAVLAVRGEA
jgi:nucleotide-binding universal stress UspA family protein